MIKKSFKSELKNVSNFIEKSLNIRGKFNEYCDEYSFTLIDRIANDLFFLFPENGWMPLNSYYERNDFYNGKEVVLIKEMKYIKRGTILYIHIIVRKNELICSIKKPEKVYPWELDNPFVKTQIIKGDNIMGYKVDDRVVVNLGSKKKPHYFLANILKVKGEKVKVDFDNDDDPEIIEEDAIVGYGISKKFKKEINPEFLEDYLEEEKPKKKKVVSDGEEEEAPKKKKVKDEEEEEKPKKKKVRDDEDEDEKPKKKKVISNEDEEEEAPKKKIAVSEDVEIAIKEVLEEIQNILDKDLKKIIEKMNLMSEFLTEMVAKKKQDEQKSKPSKEEPDDFDEMEDEEPEEKPVKKVKEPEPEEIDEDDNWLDED